MKTFSDLAAEGYVWFWDLKISFQSGSLLHGVKGSLCYLSHPFNCFKKPFQLVCIASKSGPVVELVYTREIRRGLVVGPCHTSLLSHLVCYFSFYSTAMDTCHLYLPGIALGKKCYILSSFNDLIDRPGFNLILVLGDFRFEVCVLWHWLDASGERQHVRFLLFYTLSLVYTSDVVTSFASAGGHPANIW